MTPAWFSGISWSAPVALELLRANRNLLPNASGVYVFTNYDSALQNNTGVLYVGKATSLFSRVQSYLADPSEMLLMSARSGGTRVNTSLKHAGKAQLLVKIQQKSRGLGPSGIWVRWTQIASPASLETDLIGYLRPAFNTQGMP